MSCFEQALLGLFLALDAVASPGDGFEALRVDFFSAGNAFTEAAFAETGERAVHHLEQLAVVVALAEEKFLVVRTGGAIGDVLGGLVIRTTAVLLVAGHHVAQFFLPRFQPLSKIFQLLLVHDCRSQSPSFSLSQTNMVSALRSRRQLGEQERFSVPGSRFSVVGWFF